MKHRQFGAEVSSVLVIAGACCWGLMGTFSRYLTACGLDSMQIAVCRCGITAMILVIIGLVTDRAVFRIRLKHLPYFLGTGLLSQALFNYLYLTSVNLLTLSMAAILLYTAPFFVIIISAMLYREKITARKSVCLVTAFVGCVCASGVSGSSPGLSPYSLFIGVGAGFTYGLYTIIGNAALRHYSSFTVTIYTFIIATAGLAPFTDFSAMTSVIRENTDCLVFLAGIVILGTALPYGLYTKGLEGVESGNASIMAFAEPMVSTLMGIMVFREALTWNGLLGMALIFAALFMLNAGNRRFRTAKTQVCTNHEPEKDNTEEGRL